MADPASSSACQSIADVHERATRGEPLSVVFLGGSLTWGAQASDPQVTSYRGRMMSDLLERYPKSSIAFHDAAIGGTGSDLGVFRLERDVLSHDPDLVFLDFTINDGPGDSDVQRLAAYERIVRDLLSQGVAVLPVLLCTRDLMADFDAPVPPRFEAHRKIAEAYGCPVADVLDYARKLQREGKSVANELWNVGNDTTHPGDAGYEMYFDGVRLAYESAVAEDRKPSIPDTFVSGDLYPHRERQILADTTLPEGWERAMTYRTSMWFDGLSSRWMGDVARATNSPETQALTVKFRGSMVGIFGESNPVTLPFQVWIDDKLVAPRGGSEDGLWHIDTTRFSSAPLGSGNLFSWTLLANDLPDGEHVLRILPVITGADPAADLRIESVCSAGK